MTAILITGGAGFLGSALTSLLLAKGHKIYSLSRHPPAKAKNLIPLYGDILEPNLGLKEVPEGIDCIHHLAAIHKLGKDKDRMIWKTNVDGTKNIIAFCTKHNIPHLFFCSTAYTQGKNCYEKSKLLCELMIKESDIPKVTIFKPSIILGDIGYPYPGHLSQFISLLIKVHHRAECVRMKAGIGLKVKKKKKRSPLIRLMFFVMNVMRRAEITRRKVESAIRLPVAEPVFRIRGDPEGELNLVTVGDVAKAMADIEETGVYWLTNPSPPSIGEMVKWIGDFILLDFRVIPDFKPSPFEAMFMKIAAAFIPYTQGDTFKSDLKQYTLIDRVFIEQVIKDSLS